VTLGALRCAHFSRKFRPEEASLQRLGLVAKDGPGQVEILLRRRHARVTFVMTAIALDPAAASFVMAV
jgi:hypothetical protein